MMEAVRASETSVCFNETTQRYIPESCYLYIRRRENLKSHFHIHFHSYERIEEHDLRIRQSTFYLSSKIKINRKKYGHELCIKCQRGECEARQWYVVVSCLLLSLLSAPVAQNCI
jgi:hypothetical protein